MNKPEFFTAGFTGQLKTVVTTGGRHVFTTPLPVVKDTMYMLMLNKNGEGRMLIVTPPPYDHRITTKGHLR